MRIAVVNNFYPPRVGGSSHLSDSLAKGYAKAGHDVLVITAAYADAPAEEERDGLRIVRMPAFTLPESRFAVSFDISFATRPSLRRRIIRLLNDFDPDVIHQHGQFMDLTWATGAYARRRGVPTLLSVHTRLENPAARYRHAFRALDAFVVSPRLRKYQPRIVVMDAYMREYINRRFKGCYRDLVDIPVGVDPSWVRGGSRQAGRARLGLPDSQPLILSVGHVIPVRDRVGVVEALPRVLEAQPSARLVVVGRVYYDVFLKRARELGVEHAVDAIGAVSKSEIPDLLAAADVECHEQGDGLGTATLEAMAAGVPVVGWGRVDNFPGVPLYDGHDIFLAARGDVVGLADRLISALGDRDAAQDVGRRGRDVVDEHFDLQHVLDQHLDCLGDLVAHRRQS